MNITVEPQQLEAAINEHVGTAVSRALAGYDVQKAIAETVSESIAHGVIRDALNEALETVDTGALTKALAEQIQRTATKATVAILADGFVSTIAKLRGVESYASDRDAKIARIRAELDL